VWLKVDEEMVRFSGLWGREEGGISHLQLL
jgi:hypothetical protein